MPLPSCVQPVFHVSPSCEFLDSMASSILSLHDRRGQPLYFLPKWTPFRYPKYPASLVSSFKVSVPHTFRLFYIACVDTSLQTFILILISLFLIRSILLTLQFLLQNSVLVVIPSLNSFCLLPTFLLNLSLFCALLC